MAYVKKPKGFKGIIPGVGGDVGRLLYVAQENMRWSDFVEGTLAISIKSFNNMHAL